MPPFPVSAPAFKGNSRVVAADSAFVWLSYGWALFLGTPGVWAALTAIAFVVLLCLCFVPWLGTLLASLLLPVIGAALLHVCQKIANDQVPVIADLLAGFRQSENTRASCSCSVCCLWSPSDNFPYRCFFRMGTSDGVRGDGRIFRLCCRARRCVTGHAVAAGVFRAIVHGHVVRSGAGSFNNMSAPDALKASFEACLKNAVPLGVFGLIVMVLTVFPHCRSGWGFSY